VDGAVQHEKAGYSRTANRWQPDSMRFEQVTRHRLTELEEIRRYVAHEGCLMEFLARALDDPTAAPCGKCMNCTGKKNRRSAPAALIQEAVNFLRSDALVLESRDRWPSTVLMELHRALPEVLDRFENGRPKTVIPTRLRATEGRVLCLYGDAGWGQEVARGKYGSGRFSDPLVRAAAELISSKWKPEPTPQWVTAVPSQRHSELLYDFAERLAGELALPFIPALRKRRGAQPQKEMQNSAMQLRNLLESFEVADIPVSDVAPAPAVPTGWVKTVQDLGNRLTAAFRPATVPELPVLLVDDVVDSRWTLTLGAVLLRQHGSGPVYPFALAKASPRGS